MVLEGDGAGTRTRTDKDHQHDRLPKINDLRLSSDRKLEYYMSYLEYDRRDDRTKRTCSRLPVKSELRPGEQVSFFKIEAERDGARMPPVDCFVIWTKTDSDQQPAYVSYFAHWQEGVMLALVRRGVKSRQRNDIFTIMASAGSPALIVCSSHVQCAGPQC